MPRVDKDDGFPSQRAQVAVVAPGRQGAAGRAGLLFGPDPPTHPLLQAMGSCPG